ncbi:hypothetical protein ZIOFF_038748 [Zingiber officinale]|uniref:FAR1 domain-containing protein n=1 Tax=Zingiber officinale TaxID=94328 RepID=A0A8J5GF07_ZINOF|nr:hypothetical protein ZIOFF_038748 [Zingiber officinale]
MIPKIGMTFISEDEVRNFYNPYAQNVGFGICKLGGKKGDDGKQKYFCFGCAKSGKTISQAKNALYPRPSTKTNCKAKINVVIRNDDNFVISSVSLEHNHVLSPGKSRHFRCGLGAGMIALKYPGILYWGFTNVEEILHTGKSASAPGIWLLTQLVCAKVVATAICKGSGLVGGLYAPSLMIGAALGAVFGGSAAELINSAIPGNGAVAQPQAYALVGMAATLASVCSVPLTSVLLLFELTKDYRILLPLMVTNGFVLTKILAMGYCDLELSQLETDIHRSGTINNEMLLDDLKVSLAMSKTQRQCNVDAIVLMHDKQQTCVLIIDHEDFLEGILTLGDIRRKGFETSGELPGTPRLHSNELCKFVKLNEAMTFLDREDVVQVEPHNALLKDLCNASLESQLDFEMEWLLFMRREFVFCCPKEDGCFVVSPSSDRTLSVLELSGSQILAQPISFLPPSGDLAASLSTIHSLKFQSKGKVTLEPIDPIGCRHVLALIHLLTDA